MAQTQAIGNFGEVLLGDAEIPIVPYGSKKMRISPLETSSQRGSMFRCYFLPRKVLKTSVKPCLSIRAVEHLNYRQLSMSFNELGCGFIFFNSTAKTCNFHDPV